jgi:hypothetical protein
MRCTVRYTEETIKTENNNQTDQSQHETGSYQGATETTEWLPPSTPRSSQRYQQLTDVRMNKHANPGHAAHLRRRHTRAP